MKISYIAIKGMPLGGGIEKYTEEIGSRLADRGHQVTVYTMRHYGATDGLYRGMRIRTVPTIRTRSLEKLTASLLSTINGCLDTETDIVHFHAFGPAMFSFLPRLLGKKVVVQGHGLEWKRTRWGLFGRAFLKFSETPSVRFPHRISVVSNVQKRYIRNRYGIDSEYIPTGVNPPLIEKPDLITRYGLRGNDYILFASRLVREKGAHYLLRAYNKLNTQLKLVIAGDAEHEEAYKAELRDIAAGNNNIIFPGFVTGKLLHEFFSNCYFFVLPSEIEGLPIVLLEAMSYRNCCLVSDIPENLEAVKNFGVTFRSQNADDLSDKLLMLIQNPDYVDRLKRPASEYVLREYSWDYIAETFECFYLDLLKQR